MNDRSKYVWAKFKQWYGTSFTERYGENPPPDWMQALNDPDKETITNALSAIRTAHPKFPPTLMEVMTAIQKVTRPTVMSGYLYRLIRVMPIAEAVGLCWARLPSMIRACY